MSKICIFSDSVPWKVLEAKSISNAHTVISYCNFLWEEAGLLGQMADSESRAGNVKDEPEISICT